MQDHFRHLHKCARSFQTLPKDKSMSQIFNNKEHSKISPVSGKACLPVCLRSEGGVDTRRDQNLFLLVNPLPCAGQGRERWKERRQTSQEIRSGRREEGGTREIVSLLFSPKLQETLGDLKLLTPCWGEHLTH